MRTQKTVTYRKNFNGWLTRYLKEKTVYKGWDIVAERESKGVNLAKAGILFLIFPFLAFFSQERYIEVTYQKQG